jgi:5'-3' exonuclease
MGIHQLWKLLKEVNKGAGHQLQLSQFKGKVVVVDVSIWLIEFLKGTRNRDLISSWFNGIPARSLRPLLKEHFDMRLKAFRENEITIQLVLDGSRNPLKKETNEARIEKSRDAGEQFRRFLSDNRAYDEVDLLHILHEMVQPRIDIYSDLFHWANHNGVKITAAPIESDWQLSFASFSGDADLKMAMCSHVALCYRPLKLIGQKLIL